MARAKKPSNGKPREAAAGGPDGKLTLEQLAEMVADPATAPGDLEPYFRVAEDQGAAFDPVVEINTDTVHVPDTAEGRSRSALILNGANWLERNGRQSRFYRLLSKGNYTGPVIVEEGDSWFQYPFKLWDVIDVLMEKYAVLSLSAGGDTLENMVRRAEYRKALQSTQASILLLSAGGNDLVANGNLATHLRAFDAALQPAEYLLSSFDQLIGRTMALYDMIFRDVAQRFPQVQVVCHGYDYPVPDKGRWLGQPMATRGIVDPQLQVSIAKVMMDRFNISLARLSRSHAHVHFLDLRGVVGRQGWSDELHPKNAGYRRVGDIFAAQIDKLSRPRGRGASRSERPRAMSLHLGLNNADPAHYGAELSPLEFCIADAEAMAELAGSRGFAPILLIDAAATRDALKEAMAKAATDLQPGETFMFTYAGHGGQLPDFNGDEMGGPDMDRLDETLCLFDGQFVDDELFALWSQFREGVRVLAVFDSCHSGSVVRAPATLDTGPTVTARRMTLGAASRVFRKNEAFYRGLPGVGAAPDPAIINRELDYPVAACVVQLSACQSNQLATESLGHGRFTDTMLEVLGASPQIYGYKALMDRIASRMPPEQTPKYWRVGAEDASFESQLVFSV